MSKVRSDNISNRADDGAPALVYGAEVPVGYGITGAGGINITGVATAASSVVAGIVTTNVSGIHAGTGIITATSFSGTVASSNLSGALPALDGSALTNLNIPAGFTELDAALFN